MADNKSSLVQIAQAVLDEATQSVKVAISVDGSPVDADNPLPVVIDSQSIVVEVNLNKDNDSVTAWQGGGAWAVSNPNITEAVATAANQIITNTNLNNQITELQAIKGYLDGVESSLTNIDTKVATQAKQDSQITELQAIKGYVDGVETSLTSIDSKVSSLAIVGSGVAASALRVQLADESLSALENINVTVTNTALEITNDAGNPVPISGTVTANIGTTNGLALDTSVNSLLKPSSTLSAVTTVGSITNTVTVTGPLTDTQLRASAVPVSVAGVATAANQTAQTTELQSIKTNTQRLNYVQRARIVYSVTNVDSLSWTQVISSITSPIKEIEIFDSSGETLELGIGPIAEEVSKCYVFPGGNGRIPLQILAGERLAIKAVAASINVGEFIINLYG